MINRLRDNEVSPSTISSFYSAMRQAEYVVHSRGPNLIVAPLRGAEPIIESMRVIARLEGRELPDITYIEIGCITNILNNGVLLQPKALSNEQKIELVSKKLEDHLKQDNGHYDLCIIDEAEKGGGIVKNYDLINAALRLFYPEISFDLEAIAICGQQEKCRRFQQLQEMGKIMPIYVMDLFTVDRARYLSPLIRIGDDVLQKGEYPRDSKSLLYAEIERLHIRQR